jgi:16S rRNA (guanine527-N7)-methyltransferase
VLDGPVTLIEPRRLRADFLSRVVGELELNAQVVHGPAAMVEARFDVVTGRAVASLAKFLELCAHLSTRKTVWVIPKGRSASIELAEAERSWQGAFHVEQSLTDADSQIIVAQGIVPRKR